MNEPIAPSADREALVQRYLHGWCAHFAYAMHARTGWTMVGIHGVDEYGGPPRHVACVQRDGLFADVRGVGLSKEQVCDGYDAAEGDLAVRPVSAFEMVSRFKRESDAYVRAFTHLNLMLPDLPHGAPMLRLLYTSDGERTAIVDTTGIGAVRKVLADLDLQAVAKFLETVPQLHDVEVRHDRLVFDFDDELAPMHVDLLLGWVESAIVAHAEDAPAPLLEPLYPYSRLAPAEAPLKF